MESIHTMSQKKEFRTHINYHRDRCSLVVEARWDDCCKNGRNSLAVTGTVYNPKLPGRDKVETCGCIHDIILGAKGIPQEIKDLIPFHLADDRGPMHYMANTCYLAGDRDHSRRRAGEPDGWEMWATVGNSPIQIEVKGDLLKVVNKLLAMEPGQECYVVKVEHGPTTGYQYKPKFTILVGPEEAPGWAWCPFDTSKAAEQWRDACLDGLVKLEKVPVSWSSGKPRELDKARRAACADWPEGHPFYLSDEQLMDDEGLEETLKARLPSLVEEMRRRVGAAGFVW